MIPHHKHLKLDGTGAYLKVNQTEANQLEITIATTDDKSFKGVVGVVKKLSMTNFELMIYFLLRFYSARER